MERFTLSQLLNRTAQHTHKARHGEVYVIAVAQPHRIICARNTTWRGLRYRSCSTAPHSIRTKHNMERFTLSQLLNRTAQHTHKTQHGEVYVIAVAQPNRIAYAQNTTWRGLRYRSCSTAPHSIRTRQDMERFTVSQMLNGTAQHTHNSLHGEVYVIAAAQPHRTAYA